ncbi:hypothetical protein LCGC14_1535870 [marine sediment metagenome]|uniref:Uncharacterized protein n=1 Tax=marine sediment metagenome TaxID=412755 RepID=A0A0F9JFE5_9ZZZZ
MEKENDTSPDTIRLHLVTHTKNDGRSLFPKSFIDAIRGSIEAGFSAEQIVSILLLTTSVLSIENLDGPELIGRTKEVSTVLGGLNRRKNK